MTDLPEEAIAEAAVRDALDDKEWDRKFAQSQDFLAQLAGEGMADYEAGRTRKLKSARETKAL